MTVSKWLVRLMVAASALWSLVFIARSSFNIGGQRHYALFDDAMISMRYARNLAENNGLVWNAGEPPVEGYTNFLWTLWMTVLHWLPFPDRLTPLLVSLSGAVLLVVGVWLSAQLARLLVPKSQWAPVMAAALTAFGYPLVFWTLRGMEVGLVSVLVSASVLLVVQMRDGVTGKRLWGLGALLSLAALTRPDALILALVLVPAAFLMVEGSDRRRLALPLVALPVLTVAAHTGFRLAYYGEVVPNTYALKVSGVPLEGRLQRGVKAMAELFFKGGLLVVVVAAIVGVFATAGRSVRKSPVWILAALVVVFLAYSVYVGGDAWESLGFANRYVSTVLPLLFVLVALGVDYAAHRRSAVMAVMGLAAVFTVGVAQVQLPAVDALYEVRDSPSKWLYVGCVLVVLAASAAVAGKRWPLGRLATALLVAGLVLVTSGAPASGWWQKGAQLEDDDQATARYGVALASFTQPGTRIALSSAGNISYFAGDQRTFVDELGKMDPVIAAAKPNRPDFPPGHQKWNYGYTFDVLRPDLISQSFGLADGERQHLLRQGWRPLSDQAFVRADARGVDGGAIRVFLAQQEQGGGER